jgi:hypothetical protein
LEVQQRKKFVNIDIDESVIQLNLIPFGNDASVRECTLDERKRSPQIRQRAFQVEIGPEK